MELHGALSCVSQAITAHCFPLGKPQQVTLLVQQGFLLALCKEVTIASNTKHCREPEVT